MTVFIVRDGYGTILKVTKTYNTAVEFCCKKFLNLGSIFIQPIVRVFIKAGCEKFEELWEELNQDETYYIEEFEVIED